MKLDKALKKHKYIIDSIISDSDEIQTRLHKLGFYSGAMVEMIRKAPIFSDPIIFEVSDSQIVLTRDEARYIQLRSEAM